MCLYSSPVFGGLKVGSDGSNNLFGYFMPLGLSILGLVASTAEIVKPPAPEVKRAKTLDALKVITSNRVASCKRISNNYLPKRSMPEQAAFAF